MLGWMLKRGDAPDVADGDTTQIDQPDTPAPVFAARAFKSALFGTPAHPSDQPNKRGKPAVKTALPDQGSSTPSKPQGILLTPGTATSRRKRVSFGHDIPKTTTTNDAVAPNDSEPHKRTRLNEALEKARKQGTTKKTAPQDEFSDSDWEEDEDDHCSHDITVDLNEPHSQSGRYWKGEFQKYHKDAKVEMEKMLKYKQLAKSYAHQKDAEAVQLAEMLKHEQHKVIKMEKKIAENASHIVSKTPNTPDEASPESLAKLTRQTALAVQYRQRVQELEDQLEDFLQNKDDAESAGARRRPVASPRTQKTLIETQRELRRARAQVKELGELRDQVSSLKERLKAAEKRAGANDDGMTTGSGRTQDLRAQLRQAKEENKTKDEELRLLKADFDAFRQESQVHDQDTKAVLERAHTKIAELKKELKTGKANGPETSRKSSPQSEDEPEKKDAPKAEATDALSSRSKSLVQRQSSFEIADLEDESVEIAARTNSRSLREKYREASGTVPSDSIAKGASALAERPNLEKPRWQPFVPRSPRNRGYLGEEISNRIQNGGVTPVAPKGKTNAIDLPALAKSIARSGREASADADIKVDLLQDRFARLGGPDVSSNPNSTLLANASKSKLPPERRAAAIARIEHRMAEKKRAQRRNGYDKENVRP